MCCPILVWTPSIFLVYSMCFCHRSGGLLGISRLRRSLIWKPDRLLRVFMPPRCREEPRLSRSTSKSLLLSVSSPSPHLRAFSSLSAHPHWCIVWLLHRRKPTRSSLLLLCLKNYPRLVFSPISQSLEIATQAEGDSQGYASMQWISWV